LFQFLEYLFYLIITYLKELDKKYIFDVVSKY